MEEGKKKRINGNKKGKSFERDVANALLHIFPRAQRMLEYQQSKTIGVDLENTGEFDIQCKRNQAYAPISRIFEIQVRDPNRVPVLVTKGNNVPAMSILPFDKFISLLVRIPGMAEKEDLNSAKTVARQEEVIEVKKENISPNKEKSLPHDYAVDKIQNIVGTEVFEGHAKPGTIICVILSDDHSATCLLNHQTFNIDYQKETAAIRILEAIRSFEETNRSKIGSIIIPKLNEEITFSFL